MYICGEYAVEVFPNNEYVAESADNLRAYDLKYGKQEYRNDSIVGIQVFKKDIRVRSAVIIASGGWAGIHENAVIAKDNKIVLCCANKVFCLSIPDLLLLWEVQADDVCCFGIYPYKDTYIVHGELSISRLDNNGSIMWQHWGADIFTTIDGNDNFKLEGNYIVVQDWEERVYKFDYEGNNRTDMSQF